MWSNIEIMQYMTNRGMRLYRYAVIHDLAYSYKILIMIDSHKITHINYGFIITMSNLA